MFPGHITRHLEIPRPDIRTRRRRTPAELESGGVADGNRIPTASATSSALSARLPAPAPPGLPGSSAVLSTRAIRSHPGKLSGCSCSFLPRRFSGFIQSGRLAASPLRNEAETGSLALRLTCSPHQASSGRLLCRTLAWLLVERAIYKVNSFQFTRTARLILALQVPARSGMALRYGKKITGGVLRGGRKGFIGHRLLFARRRSRTRGPARTRRPPHHSVTGVAPGAGGRWA
jgi:hypothetical protein